MNLKEIKEVINSSIPDKQKKECIIGILAKDEKLIPTLMIFLSVERQNKAELIDDMNLELSRAHIYIDERPPIKNESKAAFNKNFVIDKISEFYIKYKSVVTHCFNRFN